MQRDEGAAADPDDVVEKADAEKVSGLRQTSRDVAIFDAGRRIARRMVVTDDDSACTGKDGGLEELARMHERSRRSSDGHDLVADAAMTAIEVDREKMLACVVGDDPTHESDRRER